MKFVLLFFGVILPFSVFSQSDTQKSLPVLQFEDVVDYIAMVPTSSGAVSDGEIHIYLKPAFEGKLYEVAYSYYPPDQEVNTTVTVKGQPLTITGLFYNTYYITGLHSTDGSVNITFKKCVPVFSAASALIPSGKAAQAFLDKAYDLVPKPEGKTAALFEQNIRAKSELKLSSPAGDNAAGKETAAFTSSFGGGNTSSFTSCQVVVPSGANAGNVVTLQSGYWYKTSNLQTPMNGIGAGTFAYLDPATCTFSTSVQAVCGYSKSADGGIIYNPNYYWSILNPTPANTASLTTNGAGLSWAQIRQAAYVYGKYGYNANTEDVVHHLFYNLTSQYSNPLNSTTQAIYNDAIANYKIITVNPSISVSNVTGAGTVGNPVTINITTNADIVMLPAGTSFTVCGGTATISGDTLKIGGTEGTTRTTSVGADLDIKAELYNSAAVLIKSYDPIVTMRVAIDTILNSGAYYLLISGSGNANTNSYGSLGGYTITGTNTLLPIYSIQLNGKMVNNSTILNWKIIADEAIQQLSVESSLDGKNFTELVQPGITSDHYSYKPNVATTIYYRLKVVLATGSVSYSNIIALALDDKTKKLFNVYTLAQHTITINATEAYKYVLINTNGAIVDAGNGKKGINSININERANGIYILNMYTNDSRQTEKIVKIN
jgi:hypothetical protein